MTLADLASTENGRVHRPHTSFAEATRGRADSGKKIRGLEVSAKYVEQLQKTFKQATKRFRTMAEMMAAT